jgi:hypothetical protein
MNLPTVPFLEQSRLWPAEGRHILAHYDAKTIVVYQAYNPAIGRYAVQHGKFGGDFSYARMSWIKPNFLWMMYRSGCGTKPGQEMTLGLRLRRGFFDGLLAQAVVSSFEQSDYPSVEAWRAAVQASNVRLQWDPDHAPDGRPLERRAIQLGLRGAVLEAFGQRELLEVIDMTDFVAEQRPYQSGPDLPKLHTPAEQVYSPGGAGIAGRLKLD